MVLASCKWQACFLPEAPVSTKGGRQRHFGAGAGEEERKRATSSYKDFHIPYLRLLDIII